MPIPPVVRNSAQDHKTNRENHLVADAHKRSPFLSNYLHHYTIGDWLCIL